MLNKVGSFRLIDRVRAEFGELPPPKEPIGLYRPAVITGNEVIVSGHGPWLNGKPVTGKVGATIDVERGAAIARLVGMGILSTLEHEVGLHRIKRVLYLHGMVNAVDDFTAHPRVIDGCARLFEQLWGPQCGVGARSAVGHNSLPENIAVEIWGRFELKDEEDGRA